MSIEIQVNEDIREYENKFLGDYTARQCGALAVFIAIELPLSILTYKFMGMGAAFILPVSITGTPIILYGFWKPHGFDFEEYVKVKINNYLQASARIYKNNNSLRELNKLCKSYEIQERKKEKKLRFRRREKKKVLSI